MAQPLRAIKAAGNKIAADNNLVKFIFAIIFAPKFLSLNNKISMVFGVIRIFIADANWINYDYLRLYMFVKPKAIMSCTLEISQVVAFVFYF